MTDQYAAWVLAEGFDKPARKRGSKLPPRKKITLTEKVAAMLCLMPPRADGTPLIPAEVRANGAKAVAAYPLDWDHIIARVLCGTDTFDNYRPTAAPDHKVKTRADKSRMAHNDRLQARREQPAQPLSQPRKRKWGSRPMAGSKASGFKHRMSGQWERRT